MSEPIRILQVLGRLDRGGAETMIMNLYRYMDKEQLQFDFVIHTEDVCDYTEEITSLGGRIYSMKPFRASTALGYRRQWRIFFREHPEYRIIHGHMRSTASLYLAEAKRAGLVTIVHSHNTSSGSGASAMVKNILQYPLRRQADYLFACGRRAGEWLYGKTACEGSKFKLLPNGIETDRFRFSDMVRAGKRRELAVGEDELVFLHIGRMEEQKNHRFLLEIVREAARFAEEKCVGKEEAPNGNRKMIRLLLCGCGPLEEELREQAAAIGQTVAAGQDMAGGQAVVDFLGVREDIPALMMAGDVMVFPSLFEGLPVTLVEAQAAGLPVLMSDTVTDEVVLTDLVQTMSLRTSACAWAEQSLETACHVRERSSYAGKIRSAGYDVEQSAGWLAEFYLSCRKEQG